MHLATYSSGQFLNIFTYSYKKHIFCYLHETALTGVKILLFENTRGYTIQSSTAGLTKIIKSGTIIT